MLLLLFLWFLSLQPFILGLGIINIRDRNNHLLAGTDRDIYIHTGTRSTYRSISLQAETVHKSLLANKNRLEYDIKVKTTSLAAIKLQGTWHTIQEQILQENNKA